MASRTRLFVAALALMAGACVGSGNPASPTTPIIIPPGAIVHWVPVAGSNRPFRWWIVSLDPPKGSRLEVGQSFKAMIGCEGPSGYSYALKEEFSSGPGTDWIRITSGQSMGLISDCFRGSMEGLNSTLRSTGYPDLSHYRFSVWTEPGEIIINPDIRPPDLVVDERIDWTINRG
ncbi:MAG: hypothetical protein G01um101430_679 [Parcubacteria group bacterium Gr01-1014_30]|nr:MAG: hypothetical protein G01um101430_679 [Parcubacteria group bacterium Gr01-1014_30]